jgi:glycosyltransferase involved in cell wall biosynthesis
MKVVYLISSGGFYGAEAMLLALARHSFRHGWDATVAAFEDSRRPHLEILDHARKLGLEVEAVPCRGRWDRDAAGRLREVMNRRSADVLHTHGYKADIYGWMAARPHRFALVATCHNWPDPNPFMRAYAALDRRALRSFDRVAAVSDSVAAILLGSGVAAEKLSVIPNGVDVERFAAARATLQPPPATQIVGFVGRLVEAKGGGILLRAARTVLAACPETLFVLAGDGPLRAGWEALAERSGICKRVLFLGVRNDMPGVYASLDMLVLPSWEEASPMCVLEAMAAGKPIVATRVGAIPNLVIPGVTGFLVEPGDVPALSEAILKLLRDPALARRFGENGRLHVSRNFSAAAAAARYIELYDAALAMRRNHGHSPAPVL